MVYKQEVESFVVPGALGYMGILPGHAPIISALNIGVLKIKKAGSEEKLAISGGFLEVANNKAVVIAETAEKAEDIELSRAQAAKDRAEQRLKKLSEVDVARAELALKRAVARINAAEK